MKVKLLRRVRRDARQCWNSIYSLTTQYGKICSLSFPSENEDVLRSFCGERIGYSDADKQKFIQKVIHRFWAKRKSHYYARYRKGANNG